MTAAASASPIDVVLDALRAAGLRIEWARNQYMAQCPVHADRSPSLAVREGRGDHQGKVALYCHAGCDTRDILDALGLTLRDLFTPDDGDWKAPAIPWKPYLEATRALTAPKGPAADGAKPLPGNLQRRKSLHYDYVDAAGALVGRVVRYDLVDMDTGEIVGKTFTQHAIAPDGAQLPTLDGHTLPLYRLPDVLEAVATGLPVLVVEGEKDADTAAQLGVVGTTCAQGAGKWREEHTSALSGAHVVVVADKDASGRRHAATVADAIRDTAASVRAVEAAAGKDLSDHVAAGLGLADLVDLCPVEEPESDEVGDWVREQLPRVDWHALWADEDDEEWIIEPLLPARRLVALYSQPKVGKSLLLLEMAAAIAAGRPILGVTPAPRVVLYVDFENDPKADTRARLKDMGYGPHDLDNLVLLSFPTLSALDSAKGAAELMAAVTVYGAQVVVVDTVSRAVSGEENDNDTWLAFYRHTGLALKQAQVALVRLDHAGKDDTKGQRGGSAKSGDVDAVWRLSKVTEDVYRLECEAKRFQIAETRLTLRRGSKPLRHEVDPYGTKGEFEARVAEALQAMEDLDLPLAAGRDTCTKTLDDAGQHVPVYVLKEALRRRKGSDE